MTMLLRAGFYYDWFLEIRTAEIPLQRDAICWHRADYASRKHFIIIL